MKKLLNFLYSTRFMAVLFVLFAVAMGVATFIENDYGTQTSKALVYNSWWFEAIMVFFIINFFGNIFRYQLYKKEKWPVLMFHGAFIFILIGAGITRYIGHEGIMLINEGETTNRYLSETTYVNYVVDDGAVQKQEVNKPILLSAWGKNSWSYEDNFKEKKFNIELVDYIPWAEKKLIADENGEEHLLFVESSSGSRHEHYIKSGTIQNIHNILVGFNATSNGANINIFKRNDSLKIMSKEAGVYQVMATQQSGNLTKDSIQDFKLRALYNVAGLPFVVPQYPEKGTMQTVRGAKDDKKLDVIVLDVSTEEKTQRIELTGGKFNSDNLQQFSVGEFNFRMWYGAKTMETPFSVKLNDFQLEKYPGSESAASMLVKLRLLTQKKRLITAFL
ncbi:MAG: serine incorporator domain-containing protein [Polaribacter sp.]|nr:serine incorporator domain-containing protein [Polaribacter sp.]